MSPSIFILLLCNCHLVVKFLTTTATYLYFLVSMQGHVSIRPLTPDVGSIRFFQYSIAFLAQQQFFLPFQVFLGVQVDKSENKNSKRCKPENDTCIKNKRNISDCIAFDFTRKCQLHGYFQGVLEHKTAWVQFLSSSVP